MTLILQLQFYTLRYTTRFTGSSHYPVHRFPLRLFRTYGYVPAVPGCVCVCGFAFSRVTVRCTFYWFQFTGSRTLLPIRYVVAVTVCLLASTTPRFPLFPRSVTVPGSLSIYAVFGLPHTTFVLPPTITPFGLHFTLVWLPFVLLARARLPYGYFFLFVCVAVVAFTATARRLFLTLPVPVILDYWLPTRWLLVRAYNLVLITVAHTVTTFTFTRPDTPTHFVLPYLPAVYIAVYAGPLGLHIRWLGSAFTTALFPLRFADYLRFTRHAHLCCCPVVWYYHAAPVYGPVRCY